MARPSPPLPLPPPRSELPPHSSACPASSSDRSDRRSSPPAPSTPLSPSGPRSSPSAPDSRSPRQHSEQRRSGHSRACPFGPCSSSSQAATPRRSSRHHPPDPAPQHDQDNRPARTGAAARPCKQIHALTTTGSQGLRLMHIQRGGVASRHDPSSRSWARRCLPMPCAVVPGSASSMNSDPRQTAQARARSQMGSSSG